MTVEIFDNHPPQAHAQFMAEDNLVLVTGLSVGVDMFKNDVPPCNSSTPMLLAFPIS